MGTARFWVESDDRDGWIVKLEDPMSIYRFQDKASAEIFAQALAQRYRPSTVSVRLKDGEIEKEWTYPGLS
jgi:hypothetical protein